MTHGRFVLIIPAYNEEATIERVLQGVARAQLDCEVVVIDDGSHDATAAIARRTGATVIQHPFNLGYGAALQTGYKYALECGASLVVQMDADGQHDPAEIRGLTAGISAGEYDLVVLDEFTYPLKYGWLPIGDVLDFLRQRPQDTHIIITGRDAPQALIDFADLVTEMADVKHPYQEGIKAQPGIEF